MDSVWIVAAPKRPKPKIVAASTIQVGTVDIYHLSVKTYLILVISDQLSAVCYLLVSLLRSPKSLVWAITEFNEFVQRVDLIQQEPVVSEFSCTSHMCILFEFIL